MQYQELRNIFLLSELSSEELDSVKSFVKLKKFNKGDMIFFDTEPYLGFYVVIDGMVKIYKISRDGREHIIHLVDKYNSFAEVPLFENAEKAISKEFVYPANAMAIVDDTQVLQIPSKPFIELIESNTKLCMKMLTGFAKRLRHLNMHVENITLKDVSKRVASFILTEYVNQKKKSSSFQNKNEILYLNISKNDLASYLGTIPETLSRSFKKIQEDEIIEVKGKNIYIKNIRKLKELCA